MSKPKLDELISEILEPLSALEPLDVSLRAARGCLVAEEIRAESDLPAQNRSGIAGYAVRSADLSAGKKLDVLSASRNPDNEDSGKSGRARRAGAGPGRLAGGKVVRVAAGALLPPNADVVLPLAGVVEESGRIEVPSVPEPGEGVCPAGSIARSEDVLLPKHRIIDDRAIGLLAAAGRNRVPVVPPPRTVVLSVGDDLAEDPPAQEPESPGPRRRWFRRSRAGKSGAESSDAPKEETRKKEDTGKKKAEKSDGSESGEEKADRGAKPQPQLQPGPPPDVAGALLTAAADAMGATAYGARPVGEDPDLIARGLDDQLIRADILVVTGAISAPTDPLREVLERIGKMKFDKGSTSLGVFGVGTIGEEHTPVIAVPRQPATAYQLFRLLVDPVITEMLGRERAEPESVVLGADVDRSEDQIRMVLVSLDDRGRAVPVSDSEPSLLNLRDADAMIRIEPGGKSLRAGASVPLLRFPNGSVRS